MSDKHFKFTFEGTVDQFEASELRNTYADEIVYITGGDDGNGRAIYANGEYYGNMDERLKTYVLSSLISDIINGAVLRLPEEDFSVLMSCAESENAVALFVDSGDMGVPKGGIAIAQNIYRDDFLYFNVLYLDRCYLVAIDYKDGSISEVQQSFVSPYQIGKINGQSIIMSDINLRCPEFISSFTYEDISTTLSISQDELDVLVQCIMSGNPIMIDAGGEGSSVIATSQYVDDQNTIYLTFVFGTELKHIEFTDGAVRDYRAYNLYDMVDKTYVDEKIGEINTILERIINQ